MLVNSVLYCFHTVEEGFHYYYNQITVYHLCLYYNIKIVIFLVWLPVLH